MKEYAQNVPWDEEFSKEVGKEIEKVKTVRPSAVVSSSFSAVQDSKSCYDELCKKLNSTDYSKLSDTLVENAPEEDAKESKRYFKKNLVRTNSLKIIIIFIFMISVVLLSVKQSLTYYNPFISAHIIASLLI